MDQTVTLWGVAASLVLVAIAIAISALAGLGLGRSLTSAAARALIQLLLLGVVLAAIIAPGRSWAWSWAWVLVMIIFAGWTVQRRVREVPRIGLLAAGAFAASAAATLGILFGFGVFPVSGQTIVPLAGMIVGNCMTATVLVSRRVVAELTEKRAEVEARLALGQSSATAATPYLRDALRTGLIPQIETTKAVGIIFLPGAMVGLILAGVSPWEAVQVQVVVMYLILGSVAITTPIVALGLRRRLFTKDHQLRLSVALEPEATH